MYKAILIQMIAVALVAAISGMMVGVKGILSAVFGGGSLVLPNLLFALRLSYGKRAEGAPRAAGFLVGIILKVVLTVALLLIVGRWYSDLHWPSLLAALFLALQSNVFALLMKTNHVN